MSNLISKLATGVGFILLAIFAVLYVIFFAGLLFIGFFDEEVPILFLIMMIAGFLGFGILFFAVLIQRLKEFKTDKYKDVEI